MKETGAATCLLVANSGMNFKETFERRWKQCASDSHSGTSCEYLVNRGENLVLMALGNRSMLSD